MRKVLGLATLIIFVFCSIDIYSKDIIGLYTGEEDSTMKISKIDKLWEIECLTISSNRTDKFNYYDEQPFKGRMKKYGETYQCTPLKELKNNIYEVVIKTNGKNKCGLVGRNIGIYYGGKLPMMRITSKDNDDGVINFHSNAPAWLDISMAQMRRESECGFITGEYRKQK